MSSVIEFNGKKYDSLTGRVLHPGHNQVSHSTVEVRKVFKPTVQVKSQALDGINPKPKKIDINSDIKPTQVKKKPVRVDHNPQVQKRQVEKPKTLMRSSVKRQKHQPSSEHDAPVRVELYKELRRERARRASHVQKSSAVSKFSKTTAVRKSSVAVRAEPLPVIAPPKHAVTEMVSTASNQLHQFTNQLEQAVQSAESHLEVLAEDKLKSKKSRKLAYVAVSITSVFLIAFGVYQAIPVFQVKMASNKAGFSAALPDYAPSGYELDKNLQANSGQVAMTYNSDAENKNYKITQTPSQWNSDSLLNNFVLASDNKYSRIDNNGRTIYLYDDGKSATWLDNGIWYKLDGANNFSTDQLNRIVQGL